MEGFDENRIRGDVLQAVNAAFDGVMARNPAHLSPSVLAYLGDTVFDLFVRTFYVESSDKTVRELHKSCSGKVCARAQAESFFRIEPLLSEEEQAVYKRGRNAHLGTVPKNAKIADYRVATGFEALLGYLYLSRKDERLAELIKAALMPNT